LNRLFGLDVHAWRQRVPDEFQQPHYQEPVEWSFWYFVKDLAVEQFGLFGNQPHFTEGMVSFDGQRPDSRA
jgi:hypothetical protein